MKEEEVIADFEVLSIQQFPGRYKNKDIKSQLVMQLGIKLGTYQVSVGHFRTEPSCLISLMNKP